MAEYLTSMANTFPIFFVLAFSLLQRPPRFIEEKAAFLLS
uniref:Uncharacterized protein n=1 Tax=uncultured bacterium contig00074 TaxID=1181553 RepID=A0A806KKH4_9BACT|nr:hypothetical protein [uncultured bacterium contig00074]